ncbi:protein of unknown function [Methanoculleus bourgensis]|uniref:Uncharacterized protein n=1 Tax=Methanoculleus bourgensis TaxID=83986 RepID=A0A0X3BQG6_9EURY|nr:protein of unknown function [Methanoculleus bourgensis]
MLPGQEPPTPPRILSIPLSGADGERGLDEPHPETLEAGRNQVRVRAGLTLVPSRAFQLTFPMKTAPVWRVGESRLYLCPGSGLWASPLPCPHPPG